MSSFGQSNIVSNGSFETNFLEGWSGGAGGVVNGLGAADGRSYVIFGSQSSIWQDLNTVTGRDYVIKFDMSGAPASVLVKWGNSYSNLLTSTNEGWVFTNCVGTATSNVTRLQFQSPSGSSLDAINVGWTEEPARVLKPLVSRVRLKELKLSLSRK